MEDIGGTLGVEQLRRAMAESAIGMCLIGRDGSFLAVNAALCRFFGLDAATLKQRTWQELTHPDDLAADLSLTESVVRGEIDHYRLAKRYRHASGATLHGDLVVTGIRDHEHRFKYFVSQIVDETERTRTQENYRVLAENASDVVFRGDAESRFEWISPSVSELLGYRVEQVLGRTVFELIHPEDREVLQRAREQLRAGKRTYFEVRLRRSDGSYRWVGATIRAVQDASGAMVGRVGSWRDLEGERQMREALAASERRLERLAERLPVGLQVFRIRKDGGFGFDYLSPQDARLLGVEQEAAMLDPEVAFSKLHPEDRAELVVRVADLAANPVPFRWDVRCEVSGEQRLLRIESAPELLENGDSLWYGIVTDVTEQRRVELALHDAAERDRLLVAESADGIVRVRVSDGVVVDANPAYCAMLGTTLEQLIGRPVSDFFAPDDRGPLRIDPMKQGQSFTSERRVVTTDGRTITVSARGRMLGDDTFLATSRDVSAEREREARSAESLRLEALGRLAGGVAHDFNNMLTTIQCAAELMLGSLPDGDPRRADAAAVLDAGGRAAELARQLLAFGRRQSLRPSVVDLRAAVADASRLLRRSLGPAIELRLELSAELEPVRVDRSQLEQVIANLVLNARDAMPEAGVLTIGAEIVTVDEATAQQHENVSAGVFARLFVRDTGVGIDPAIRPHLFEPFFTTKPLGSGTGLGLATIHGIVAQSSGFIVVDSEVGRGATFSVFLPCARREASDSEPALAPIVRPQTTVGTLLLVEDEDAVRAVTVRLLRALGYTVLAFSDADQALALDDEALGRIDLLVTDVMMPGLQGDQLAALLQQRRPALRVLLVSGFHPGQAHGALERGPFAFLAKPFTRAQLAEALLRARGVA